MSKGGRRVLVIGGGVLLALVVLQCGGCFRYTYDRRTSIGAGTVVCEHRRCEFSLVTGMEGVWLPIPHTWDGVTAQDLELKSCVIPYGEYAEFHASPDGKTVLVEPGLHTKPCEFVDVATGRRTIVPEPPGIPKDHYLVYPFQFVRWTTDSRVVIAAVEGCDFGHASEGMRDYRELWELDAQTGQAHRVTRMEQPYPHKAWIDPPLATQP